MVVADIAPDVDRSRITGVDYESFGARFPGLLELRPVDYSAYSVFAFAFVETRQGEMAELEAMLGADLRAFLRMGLSAPVRTLRQRYPVDRGPRQ